MKKLRVKRGIAGLGLFAVAPITHGECVIEYTGELITTEERDRRGGKYLFEIDNYWTIDGKDRRNLARYINHSCKPNCYAEIDEAAQRIFIYAKRKIKPEEELTYHYGKTYLEEIIGRENCRCSSCRNY